MRNLRLPAWLTVVAVTLMVAAVPLAAADDAYARRWGPDIGTTMPPFELSDHTGATRSRQGLSGERGLLLVFARSADW